LLKQSFVLFRKITEILQWLLPGKSPLTLETIRLINYGAVYTLPAKKPILVQQVCMSLYSHLNNYTFRNMAFLHGLINIISEKVT
jgi:hypothetical protein